VWEAIAKEQSMSQRAPRQSSSAAALPDHRQLAAPRQKSQMNVILSVRARGRPTVRARGVPPRPVRRTRGQARCPFL
jgi:hypothetical protein